ncbi:winged helix-turn-helix domain-containing protein [Candidatus Spongiihabitans sp.]|uniref:winged helix-turn-helix domain-containing protein n=1 Tax=Candidatus Spongiihabitans sp. TaxID=3101308 RepID=UPI003C6EE8CC
MRVLIIEDDQATAAYIQKGLAEAGHAVDIAVQGDDGLSMATSENYQALIVDRMLPVMDGLTVIAALRLQNNHTPALILSALGDVDERVEGLKAGGDDYLTKPFAFSELLARLEALERRSAAGTLETTLAAGDLVMNLLDREVKRGDTFIDLQPREFRLLEYLMRHRNQVVTRTMLLENVWDYNFDPQTNVIDVHISRLRGKIDKNFDTQLLNTVRGAGYILRAAKT